MSALSAEEGVNPLAKIQGWLSHPERLHMDPVIDLSDESLFGNDAAEDESQPTFDSYIVEREEVKDFLMESHPLRIIRAYRGQGKSAILRMAENRLRAEGKIVSRVTGSALAPTLTGIDSDTWLRGWKQSIFRHIACKIGETIGLAWTDDSITLVEEAERSGVRKRSFVSMILDRIRIKDAPAEVSKPSMGDPEHIVSRWLEDKHPIWIIIDDIDENFENTPEYCTKVAAAFSAFRDIVNTVPEIRIRVGIRPNIWAILQSQKEALGKVDQYMLNLRWTTDGLRSVLAKRVEGYLTRTNQKSIIHSLANYKGSERERKLIEMVFQGQMVWGMHKDRTHLKEKYAHEIIATMSHHRPRWMIQLAKAAANKAKQCRCKIIQQEHLTAPLEELGSQRIKDMAAEFGKSCPQISQIINAFANLREDYTTAELLTAIQNRVLNSMNVHIAGKGEKLTSREVGALLFQIGFLTARQENESGYRHYTFEERPSLLESKNNIDHGCTWEIHPIFRQALGLRNSQGRELRPKR
jgi:hypothetical protein